MGCLGCVRCIFCFLNFILLIFALIIFGLGFAVKWGLMMLAKEKLKRANESERKFVLGMLSNILYYIRHYPDSLISFGFILAIQPFLGLVGGTCGYKYVLMVFEAIMFCYVLSMLGITLAMVANYRMIADGINSRLVNFFADFYVGPSDYDSLFNISDTFRSIFDGFQMGSRCCGIIGSDDYARAWRWTNRTFLMDGTLYNATISPACCHLGNKSIIKECLEDPTPANSNVNVSCAELFWSQVDMIWSPFTLAMFVFFVYLLIVFLTGLAILLCDLFRKKIKKEN